MFSVFVSDVKKGGNGIKSILKIMYVFYINNQSIQTTIITSFIIERKQKVGEGEGRREKERRKEGRQEKEEGRQEKEEDKKMRRKEEKEEGKKGGRKKRRKVNK